jgi:hypothetical protein
MLDHVAEELSSIAGWRRVLEAYATLATAAAVPSSKGESSDASESLGWVPRLSRLDGVEPERLSALHGKLIALGLLSFEISGKLGMQYQISPLGRRTLGRVGDFEEPSSDESAATPVDDSEDAELEAA